MVFGSLALLGHGELALESLLQLGGLLDGLGTGERRLGDHWLGRGRLGTIRVGRVPLGSRVRREPQILREFDEVDGLGVGVGGVILVQKVLKAD